MRGRETRETFFWSRRDEMYVWCMFQFFGTPLMLFNKAVEIAKTPVGHVCEDLVLGRWEFLQPMSCIFYFVSQWKEMGLIGRNDSERWTYVFFQDPRQDIEEFSPKSWLVMTYMRGRRRLLLFAFQVFLIKCWELHQVLKHCGWWKYGSSKHVYVLVYKSWRCNWQTN